MVGEVPYLVAEGGFIIPNNPRMSSFVVESIAIGHAIQVVMTKRRTVHNRQQLTSNPLPYKLAKKEEVRRLFVTRKTM